jgi:hypothetical protein
MRRVVKSGVAITKQEHEKPFDQAAEMMRDKGWLA